MIVLTCLFAFLIVVQSQSGIISAPGLWYFHPLIWLNFVAISLSACFFATAITEEKEELTLELFTIAGIRPTAILLGKGINPLIAALSVLVVQIPFTLLAITLGGVTYVQILAAYVALAAYLFLAAAIGLFFSVICARSGQAMFWTAIFVLAIHFTAPLLQSGTSALIFNGHLSAQGTVVAALDATIEFLRAASVWERIPIILKANFQGPVVSFQVTSNLIAGGVLFLLLSAIWDFQSRSLLLDPITGLGFQTQSLLSRLLPGSSAWKPTGLEGFSFFGGW